MESAVFDTAIGLAFIFLAISLICSGIAESAANVLNKRASFLLRGLRQLLDGSPNADLEKQSLTRKAAAGANETARAATVTVQNALIRRSSAEVNLPAGGLTEAVFGHVLIRGLKRPSVRWPSQVHNPSYVSGATISQSLLDMLLPGNQAKTVDAFIASATRLPENLSGRDALLALARDAGSDIDRLRTSIEHWYDEQVLRVSGWYRRWVKKVLIVLGLAIAIGGNVDAIAIGGALYHDEHLRQSVAAQAVSAADCPALAKESQSDDSCLENRRAALRELALPIGWTETNQPNNLSGWILKGLGWLLVVAAATVGGPFWFDTLGRLGSLRNAGPKPAPAD